MPTLYSGMDTEQLCLDISVTRRFLDRERSAAQKLLAASCIKIVGDYFGVGRMPGGERVWGH